MKIETKFNIITFVSFVLSSLLAGNFVYHHIPHYRYSEDVTVNLCKIPNEANVKTFEDKGFMVGWSSDVDGSNKQYMSSCTSVKIDDNVGHYVDPLDGLAVDVYYKKESKVEKYYK